MTLLGILRGSLYFVFILLLAPVMTGSFVVQKIRPKEKDILFAYIMGVLFNWALYQCIGIPAIHIGLKLSTTSLIYHSLLLVFMILGKKALAENFKLFLRGKKMFCTNKKYLFLRGVTLVFIAVQIIFVVTHQPTAYSDDVVYQPFMNDMIWENSMYPFNAPTSGVALEDHTMNYRYAFTSYYPWLASIAQASGIHILIVTKTVYPICMISLYYLTAWMLAKWIFKNDYEKALTFILLFSLITIYGGYGEFNVAKRVLLYVWNGKTALALCTLPTTFVVMNQEISTGISKKTAALAVLFQLAASMNSLMGVGLAPLMIGGIAASYGVIEKSFKLFFKGCLLCIPSVVYMAIIVILR